MQDIKTKCRSHWKVALDVMHRAIDGDGVQQVHVGARRVPDDGARPAQAPHEGHYGPERMFYITQRVYIPKGHVCMGT